MLNVYLHDIPTMEAYREDESNPVPSGHDPESIPHKLRGGTAMQILLLSKTGE